MATQDNSENGKHGRVRGGKDNGKVGEIRGITRDEKFPNKDTIDLQIPGERCRTFLLKGVEILTFHPDGTPIL